MSDQASVGAILSAVVQRGRASRAHKVLKPLADRLFAAYPNSPVVIQLYCDVFASELAPARHLALRTRCVNLSPHDTTAIRQLADLHFQINDIDTAIRIIEAAEQAGLYEEFLEFKLGYYYALKGRHEAAVAMYFKALRKQVTQRTCMNLASSLRHLGRYEESAASSKRALLMQPQDSGVYYNFGNLERERGDAAGASRLFRRGECLDPKNYSITWNFSQSLMAQGEFVSGFRKYKDRWHFQGFPTRIRYPGITNVTDLSSVSGRLFVYSEQGRGDNILFVRFLNRLTAALPAGTEVTVECFPDLLPLFERSFPSVRFVPYTLKLPDGYDFYFPLFDIARVLGVSDVSDLTFPYLVARQDEALRVPDTGRPKVALTWAGNPDFVHDKDRSARIGDIAPLFDTDAVSYFGLQKGIDEGEIEARYPGARDLSGDLKDFDDTARLMSQMDLIVSSCTSTANLAGALGKRGLVVVGHVRDWRWMTGPHSRWYPSLRILQKPRNQSWRDFYALVRDEIRKEAESL
ncbi:tetratricopeptide repeat-containing glycosyltransferase family protein [Thalassobaculum sp. OXR-137]|uniref:tetratricopeptide repeat-containing glycosyltransferase family protein n=1 Tax=Thalassobaculum sp. OXR-137 TaxID=3100173 RepID=UPI002AC93081|nr:tetratricopeptide repeat-containing glycosyltransferase family protein [Thalassobaculum sp. OXR-137]WPZ36200.1 tetratricopeptide repeat-containing glycosyltransferase family protein [Thalassobaculum sp. OXR-137]